ncbi:MAG: SDR family NAD(P)-dependent oxidoreductase [Alistipes sp.]|nr:SDR family NAD(P)-dependent oxidoreductase [Alistipes sp.]
MKQEIRSIVIVGATSGIGREVAEQLAERGVRLGIAGRRVELLEELRAKYGPERVAIAQMDVTEPSAAEALDRLLEEVGAPDVLLFASGVGKQNPELEEVRELTTVRTNCEGMVRTVDRFINYVKRESAYNDKHRAHVAVITSVAGTMGMGQAPAYSASKSMQSAYIVALAQHVRMQRIPVTFTDIRPGFVATELLNPAKHYPMLMSKAAAARHIIRGIERRRRIVIFDWRFRCIVALWRLIPRWLWERITIVKN